MHTQVGDGRFQTLPTATHRIANEKNLLPVGCGYGQHALLDKAFSELLVSRFTKRLDAEIKRGGILFSPLEKILKISHLLKFLKFCVLVTLGFGGVARRRRELLTSRGSSWRREVGGNLELRRSIPSRLFRFDFSGRAAAR